MQRFQYPLFQNQCPHFLLFRLFWKLSSDNYLNPHVRINKMVNKHTVDYYRLLRETESRIFLEFFLDLYIPPCFKVSNLWLRLLANTFVSQKIECLFLVMPPSKTLPQVFIITPPPRQKEITHSSWTAFSQDLFFLGKKGGEDYGVEKITKIKPTRLLPTSFDKFRHLCNLYIFGFCFVVP